MTAQTYLITMTRTKVQDVPAMVSMHARIETRTRKPESRAYTIDVPSVDVPDTSAVPEQFRALVSAALMETMETVLTRFVTSPATQGNANIPSSLFTLEALLTSASTSRMTGAVLLGMWRNSSKYVLDVAPKLSSLTGSALLRYQAAIEKHEKRVSALAGRAPETTLSSSDLDKLMTNLHNDDAGTAFGEYLADRTEEVRAKLTEDQDAL